MEPLKGREARGSPLLGTFTMLPPIASEASASDWLRGKPAPQSCSEKRLGTWVCFWESKTAQESSGCARDKGGVLAQRAPVEEERGRGQKQNLGGCSGKRPS